MDFFFEYPIHIGTKLRTDVKRCAYKQHHKGVQKFSTISQKFYFSFALLFIRANKFKLFYAIFNFFVPAKKKNHFMLKF